jgi:hypothetical protein
MTRKSRSATLLATIAAFSLATGTAFAASDRGNGYVYPNFWGQTSAEQPSSATAAHQSDGSVGIFITQNGHETTSLFPPNPNW